MLEDNKKSTTWSNTVNLNIENQGPANSSGGGPVPGMKPLPPFNQHTIEDILTAVIITIGPSNFSVFMVCLALPVNLKAAESCQAQN